MLGLGGLRTAEKMKGVSSYAKPNVVSTLVDGGINYARNKIKR